MSTIDGIVAVMLTPFTQDDQIDYPGLERLIDWYIEHGADALFAVCQSSEMQFLSLQERTELSRRVVTHTAERVPVISSGHVSDDMVDQIAELEAIAATGIDALILVTNRIDPNNEGSETFLRNLERLMDTLPEDLPLGLYECPAPRRRLLSDEELHYCADNGRFVLLKDVSCDLATVTRRVRLVKNTSLAVINANAAIAYEAMQAGSRGFSGVFTNFHPDLYHWLYHHAARDPDYARRLSWFLSLSAVTETLGYPKNAKIFHQRSGTFGSTHSRTVTDDVLKKYRGLDVILKQISASAAWHRRHIAGLTP